MSQGAYPSTKEDVWKPLVIEGGAGASIAEEVTFFSEAPLCKAMTRVWSHHKLVEELLLILKIVNDFG